MIVAHADGSGWNGFDSAVCVMMSRNNKPFKNVVRVFQEKYKVPEIEYLACIEALQICKVIGVKDEPVKLYMDSQEVVDELNQVRVAKQSLELYEKALSLKNSMNVTISWIPRTKNLAGIRLDKRLNQSKHNFKPKSQLMTIRLQQKKFNRIVNRNKRRR